MQLAALGASENVSGAHGTHSRSDEAVGDNETSSPGRQLLVGLQDVWWGSSWKLEPTSQVVQSEEPPVDGSL